MTTGVQSQKDFNSLPHAEVDAKQALSNYSITLFQLTTSRRGRRKRHSLRWKQNYFNSLPHAEVDSYIFCIVNMLYIFQLTTSRRGRLDIRGISDTVWKFQLTTSRRGRQQFVTKSMDINHRFHNKSHNKSLFFALIILCLSIFH